MSINRKLKVYVNITLLSIAVLFACLLIQLKYAPKSIDWIGENISKGYASVHKHKMESALEKLALGEELPSVNLLRSWINIKKGDRIFPHKRNLFIELAKRVRREKRYKDLLTLSELWIELDDRDITARAYYYEALRFTEERRLEGEEGLRALFFKFPTNSTVAECYYPLVAEHEDQEIFRNTMESRFTYGWNVYWTDATTRGFTRKNSKPINLYSAGGNDFQVDIKIDGDVLKWRLDPPGGVLLRILNPVMIINDSKYTIQPKHTSIHDINISGNTWSTNGGNDPYFFFSSESVTGDASIVGDNGVTSFQFTLPPFIEHAQE
jgi:hypothetical protein